MITRYDDEVRHLASAPVVVGVDGSAAADSALTWAADLALQRGRELRIVHGMDIEGMRRVFGRYDVWRGSVPDALQTQGGVLVERAARRVVDTMPGLRVETEASAENAGKLLLRHSATAYVVVLGASGTSGLLAHVGSITLAMTAHTEGPMVVVRTDPESDGQIRRDGPVVVGVDGSPAGEAALAAAFEEAAERDAELVAVHVWDDMNFGQYAGDSYVLSLAPDIEVTEQALVAERLAGWQEKYPEVLVTRRVSHGCGRDAAGVVEVGPVGGGRQPRPRRIPQPVARIDLERARAPCVVSGDGRASGGGAAVMIDALVPAEIGDLDAWWRAADYLAAGQIYLLDNPLRTDTLAPHHIKPRPISHWGTVPGITLTYAHLNQVIMRRRQPMLFVCGSTTVSVTSVSICSSCPDEHMTMSAGSATTHWKSQAGAGPTPHRSRADGPAAGDFRLSRRTPSMREADSRPDRTTRPSRRDRRS
jgi:nucleotide-binding universal stress UspA family protein